MRAMEQGAGGGHQGALKKRPGTAIRGAEIPEKGPPMLNRERVDEKSSLVGCDGRKLSPKFSASGF